MSGWGLGWFGGGAQKKKEAPKHAILQLRSTQEMLTKRENHLQRQMEEQEAIARKNVNSNKAVAKSALRRKNQFEKALEQTSAQMMTVEREISSIETANINKETLDAMRNASKAMKEIHGGMTVDKVDQTMEDLRDQHDISEQINEAITQGANTTNALDDEELEDELQQMQQEQLDSKMMDTGTVPQDELNRRMPTPATAEPKSNRQQEEDEEEELKKLQAEMAM